MSLHRLKRLGPRSAVCLIRLLLLVEWSRLPSATASAAAACSRDSDCVASHGQGSICRPDSNTCSNAFERGCLYGTHWNQLRVCNSEDPPTAVADGLCRVAPMHDADEIRIFAHNWESALFESWILQILLSELLELPTTVETGDATALANFYHPDSPFAFGTGLGHDALRTAQALNGNCPLAQYDDTENYVSCAHIVTEEWNPQVLWEPGDLVYERHAELQSLGTYGLEGWFVTKFTAEEDPSLISYLGLANQREKLADLFLRPTTWYEYCTEESPTQCETPDETAQRPPETPSEEQMYFYEGLFRGYFRKTDENDCGKHPDSCTGHIADFPCAWSSTVESQAHHLNVALRSSGPEPNSRGYTYSQQRDIWHAANATRSHCIMQYWEPESLYHKFLGTDAEFTRVMLPPATQTCYDNRVTLDQKCAASQETRLGTAEGVCEDIPNILQKSILTSLGPENREDDNNVEATKSPAYDVLRNFRMDNLQLSDVFTYWRAAASPREGVCQWVLDNLDYMEAFVPPTYPRQVKEIPHKEDYFLMCSLALGCLSFVLSVSTAIAMVVYREKRTVVAAQLGFCLLVLLGSGLISIGAILKSSPPSNLTCIASIWFINIGYTSELTPLIIKIAAIQKMLEAARRLRRVVVSRKSLYGAVLIVVAFVTGYLIVWTLLDAPQEEPDYLLTDEVDPTNGSTQVEIGWYCASQSTFWEYLSIAWTGILLLAASLMAFKTRAVNARFNESRTLAFMIYSHFMCAGLRVTIVALSTAIRPSYLRHAASILYSLDTIAAIIIYFIPIWVKQSESLSMDFSNHRSFDQDYNNESFTNRRRPNEASRRNAMVDSRVSQASRDFVSRVSQTTPSQHKIPEEDGEDDCESEPVSTQEMISNSTQDMASQEFVPQDLIMHGGTTKWRLKSLEQAIAEQLQNEKESIMEKEHVVVDDDSSVESDVERCDTNTAERQNEESNLRGPDQKSEQESEVSYQALSEDRDYISSDGGGSFASRSLK